MRTLILLISILPSCASAVSVEPGEPFALQTGDSMRVPACDLTIRLAEVREDSRCPAETNCIWAGDAVVVLELEQARDVPRELIVRLTDTGGVTHGTCTISVQELSPQPVAGRSIEQAEYVVRLLVEEVE